MMNVGKNVFSISLITVGLHTTIVSAQNSLPAQYQILSGSKNYRLEFASVSEKTTGTISLIDESTSNILARINVVPGKLRKKPEAVWRENRADVAIELDTYNSWSPAYIFFFTRDKGHVGLIYGNRNGLSGYLGIESDKIVRSRYIPLYWQHTSPEPYQIINMREQSWDKNNQRYTKGEPVLINADGEFPGR